jgi:hypothetical protein
MKNPGKLYWYGYVSTWVLGFAIPLLCPIEDDIRSRSPTFIAATPHFSKIEGSIFHDNIQHFSPIITLKITQFDSLKGTALFKAQCSDKAGAVHVDIKCDGSYLKQYQWYGTNLVDSANISLSDRQEKDWNVKADGNARYFPFDTYTIVDHSRKIPFISIDAEVPGFKQKILSQWETKTSQDNDYYTTLTVQFSRPWCMQVFALIILGVIGSTSIYFSCLKRDSPQAFIPLLLAFIPAWPIRQAFGVPLSFPTVFDSLVIIFPIIGILSAFILASLLDQYEKV